MTDWVRLWHDMPTDPKWRTIARKSGQRIGDVIAVFTFTMVNASANADERGTLAGFVVEDIATALDMGDEDVEAILSAMQGRVLDGDRLTGWRKRQPTREDNSAAERKAAQRNRDRAARDEVSRNVTHGHAMSRNVTQRHAPETETETETDINPPTEGVILPNDRLPVPTTDDEGNGQDDDQGGDEKLTPADVIAAWNDMAERNGLAKVARLTADRKRKLAARIKDSSFDEFADALAAIDRSPFCKGDNDRGWRANFDFFLQPSSFAKLIEGHYDNGR